MPSQSQSGVTLPEWRIAIIQLFVQAAQMIGLPKSVGQIYGLLFSSVEALPMDTIMGDLGISKGSASQGLKFLRQLGAVKLNLVVGDRRDHFFAEVRSKRLISGLIREKLIPALEDGEERLLYIRDLIRGARLHDAPPHHDPRAHL